MSAICLFVVLVIVISVQAKPQFNPFEFVNYFVPQPFVPSAPAAFQQPYIPNYGHVFSQFGKAQGNIPLNGGAVQFQASNFGFGGDNVHKRIVATVIGHDGKLIQKVYENNNGVETEKEIVGKPNAGLFRNGFSNSMIMASEYGGGKYDSTLLTAETGLNGETIAKVYKNTDGKEVVKEFKL